VVSEAQGKRDRKKSSSIRSGALVGTGPEPPRVSQTELSVGAIGCLIWELGWFVGCRRTRDGVHRGALLFSTSG